LRELRLGFFSADGRRLVPPLFLGKAGLTGTSRALFFVRNEDVGTISELEVSSESPDIRVGLLPPTLLQRQMVLLAVDFSLPADYHDEEFKVISAKIHFEGVVTGFL